MAVPNTFSTATSAIPLANLDANFTYYDNAFSISGTATTFTGTATATKLIPTGSSATGNGLYLPAANSVGISTNGTNAVYIDSSQNVGIGTLLPNTNLTVGTPNTQSTPTILSVGGVTQTIVSGSGQLGIYGTDAAAADKGGTISFTANTTSVNGYAMATISGKYQTAGAGVYGGYLQFATTDSGGTVAERMRISSAGDVGIGTNTPAYKLDVTSTSSAVGSFARTTGTAVLKIQGISGSSVLAFGDGATLGATSVWSLGRKNSDNSFRINYNEDSLDTTNYVTINTSGNVGIGTNAPAALLDINGSSGWAGGTTGNVANIKGANATVSQGGNLRVLSSTTFGIDLGGSIALGGQYTSGFYLDFAQIAGRKENATDGSAIGYLAFATRGTGNTTERMRITSAGDVGIGTNTPTQKLQVNGAIIIGNFGSNQYLYFDGTTNYVGRNTSNGDIYLTSAAGQGVALTVGGTTKLYVASTGIVTMSAYGAGAATFSAAGVISSVSDETWKIKDGVPVDPDSMLKKLEPGYWYYNDEKKEIFGTARELGFYAQNVNAAIGPEAAPTPKEGKPWGYYDRSVLAVTVMSLQKALSTIESLTARIEALEAK